MIFRKLFSTFTLIFILLMSTAFISGTENYDRELVEISTAVFKSEKFHFITFNRQNHRISTKYFAATDPYNNKTVPNRYHEWKKGKNIIAVSSGTYMTTCSPASAKPVGLCIDNGVVVNNSIDAKLGGLVIVNQKGDIIASKISDGNLNIQENGSNKIIDIKKSFDRSSFINWAKNNDATVFQSHLLIYDDVLNTTPCPNQQQTCARKASRRFLAVGLDEQGQPIHIIVHSPSETTLHDGASKVFRFLKEFKEMRKINFMINLDTGCQDVFNLYQTNGSKVQHLQGALSENDAVNILVYHYE